MNLLILVTAVFAVLAYFMFGVTDIVVANAAQQIANAKANQALGVVNSNKLCFVTPINMPSSITYFGDTREFYYAMKISREPETTQTDPGTGEKLNNTLIFAIVNRNSPDRIIAAKSIDVDAEIILFNWDGKTGLIDQVPDTSAADDDYAKKSIIIDPHAMVPVNSFVLVKEVYEQENYLYVIACQYGSTADVTNADCYDPITANTDFRCDSSCRTCAPINTCDDPPYDLTCQRVPSVIIHTQCQANMDEVRKRIDRLPGYQIVDEVPDHPSSCLTVST